MRELNWSSSSVVSVRSGSVSTAARELDPANRLLHHYATRRLEAEAIRDSLLAVSGRLDPQLYGRPVLPPRSVEDDKKRLLSGPLDGGGRRSLYTRVRRNFLPPLLVAFDMPVPFQAMGRRTVTNVPAQALALMNDPFVAEQATLWARRTLADATLTPEARIDGMYRRAFARPPTAEERAAALDFLAAQAGRHGADFAANQRHEIGRAHV